MLRYSDPSGGASLNHVREEEQDDEVLEDWLSLPEGGVLSPTKGSAKSADRSGRSRSGFFRTVMIS